MLYSIVAWIIRMILRVFYRFRVEGKEHLPITSGYVIACTHMGWLDVLVLGISIYPHKIYFMAKKELFENGVVRWFLSKLQAFPVNREKPGPSSLKIPIRLLKKGKVVGIFPSGTRTTGEDAPLKRGATYLAQKANVPLVPAIYQGPPSIRLRDLFEKREIVVTIGEPLDPTQEDLLNVMSHRMKQLAT